MYRQAIVSEINESGRDGGPYLSNKKRKIVLWVF